MGTLKIKNLMKMWKWLVRSFVSSLRNRGWSKDLFLIFELYIFLRKYDKFGYCRGDTSVHKRSIYKYYLADSIDSALLKVKLRSGIWMRIPRQQHNFYAPLLKMKRHIFNRVRGQNWNEIMGAGENRVKGKTEAVHQIYSHEIP